jgi:hypothetical protein
MNDRSSTSQWTKLGTGGFCLGVLGLKPGALHMLLSKSSTTELHPALGTGLDTK